MAETAGGRGELPAAAASPPVKISSSHMKPADVVPDLPVRAAYWELRLGWMKSLCGEELGSETGRDGGGNRPEILVAAALCFCTLVP